MIVDSVTIALAWLGRQGARALAALVFLGIALPPVDAFLKAYVTEAVFALLVISFVRLDVDKLRAHLERPRLIFVATVWTSVVMPIIFCALYILIDVPHFAPDVSSALMLQAIASPMMATPAIAALMGLDATLVLVTMIASTALIPLSAPFFAHLFIGAALPLSPIALGLKLLAILAASAIVGILLRHAIGRARIEARKNEIDGINILVLFVFVAAMMENVASYFIASPWLVAGLTAIAFGVYFLLLVIGAVVFLRTGMTQALSLGLMASQRNMGLMIAVTAGVLPDIAWLYFALSQFPIYLSPYFIQPWVRRLISR